MRQAKKLKTSRVEEVTFDDAAREEFLTGFHKRKVQRTKRAQEQAAKREHEEKLQQRRELRAQRRRELEQHVEAVAAVLSKAHEGHSSDSPEGGEESENGSDTEWVGFDEYQNISKQDQFVDEGLYTTVTVEAVDVSREGIHAISKEAEDDDGSSPRTQTTSPRGQSSAEKKLRSAEQLSKKRVKKKKRFRYETKAERTVQKLKARAKRKTQEQRRRGLDA